jgi:hypothetical protein
VQDALRKAFARWGLPGELRFDNGHPWGSAGDLPTALELWLAGLGAAARLNRPRQPRDNGVVERLQGVSKAWAEPDTCASPHELRRRLLEVDRLHRGHYPWRGHPSRLGGCPGLAHSGRPYTRGWERRHWDLGRALAHLAGFCVARRVDSAGVVSVYDRSYYVGKAHHGRVIWVRFDPQARSWVFADDRGHQLREHKAEQLTRQRIVGLDLGREPRRQRSGQDQT